MNMIEILIVLFIGAVIYLAALTVGRGQQDDVELKYAILDIERSVDIYLINNCAGGNQNIVANDLVPYGYEPSPALDGVTWSVSARHHKISSLNITSAPASKREILFVDFNASENSGVININLKSRSKDRKYYAGSTIIDLYGNGPQC